jgi:hypothetical protein
LLHHGAQAAQEIQIYQDRIASLRATLESGLRTTCPWHPNCIQAGIDLQA